MYWSVEFGGPVFRGMEDGLLGSGNAVVVSMGMDGNKEVYGYLIDVMEKTFLTRHRIDAEDCRMS